MISDERATVGDGGDAVSSQNSLGCVDEGRAIVMQYYEVVRKIDAAVLRYLDDGGLKPNTLYRMNENGEFVEA